MQLESVIQGGWFVVSGGGSSSQDSSAGIGEGSVAVSLVYLCDHSFSRFIAACISGEGCSPEEVRSDARSVMNVEMTGCRYRAVVLPI